jgi:hypothetical protein
MREENIDLVPLVRAGINHKIAELKDQLADGKHTPEAYQQKCGRIKGLQDAQAVIDEQWKKVTAA